MSEVLQDIDPTITDEFPDVDVIAEEVGLELPLGRVSIALLDDVEAHAPEHVPYDASYCRAHRIPDSAIARTQYTGATYE